MASPVKEAVPTVPLHQPLSEGSAPPKGPSTSLTNDLGVVAGTAVWFRRHVGPSVSLASGGPSRPSRNRHSHHSALSHNQAAGLRCRVTDVPLGVTRESTSGLLPSLLPWTNGQCPHAARRKP